MTKVLPSSEVIQLTLTLEMTYAQVVETSVTVNNSPIQDYVHLDDHAQPTYEMTPGLKPFTRIISSAFLPMHLEDSLEVHLRAGAC